MGACFFGRRAERLRELASVIFADDSAESFQDAFFRRRSIFFTSFNTLYLAESRVLFAIDQVERERPGLVRLEAPSDRRSREPGVQEHAPIRAKPSNSRAERRRKSASRRNRSTYRSTIFETSAFGARHFFRRGRNQARKSRRRSRFS